MTWKKTGFSRSTFYRHFIDKDDLIHYVYDIKVLPYGEGEVYERDPKEADAGKQLIQYAEYGELIWQLGQIRKYSRFMKMALTLDGINSLRNHMTVEKYRREL